MERIRFVIIYVLLSILNGVGVLHAEVIEVLAFEYPPIYQNEKDPGLSCEIVIEAFKAVDLEVELRFLPVMRMIRRVSEGEALCAIGGAILFNEPDTLRTVEISSVVQYVVQTFIYDTRRYPEGITYGPLSDMRPYEIGVLNGSGIMRFLEQASGLKLHPNTHHEGTVRQLIQGRVDVWAIVDLTGLMYLKNLFPAEADHYRFTEPYNIGDVSLVFSKIRDPENRYNTLFRQGLEIIKKNGTYLEVMAKYYGGKDRINPRALSWDMRGGFERP